MEEAHRRVIWSPAAQQDLIDIWRYYARVGSADIADNMLHEIEFAAERLSVEPLMWRAREDLLPGVRAALVDPYVVFYRTRPASNAITAEIIRVLHQHRDLPSQLLDESK